MKKLLKCLCLLLVIPVVSVFALTGCKDKNDNRKPEPKYISYGNIEKVIDSAFVALYGNTIPALPEDYEEPTDSEEDKEAKTVNDGTTDSGSTNTAVSKTTTIEVSQSTLVYNSAADKTDCFTTESGKTAKTSTGTTLNLQEILRVPLTIARSLMALEKYDVLSKTMTFSYENFEDIYPDNLTCHIKITAYEKSILIECNTTSGGDEFEAYFVNIVYDASYTATKIMYCLSSEFNTPTATSYAKGDEDQTPSGGNTPSAPVSLFCFAVYNISADTTSSMNYTNSNLSNDIQALKTSIRTFKTTTGTDDKTYNLYMIYCFIQNA